MRLAWMTIVPVVLGFSACHTPPKKPSLLDREFETYRLDRDERRLEDLKTNEAKARAETLRLEGELSALMRRIREAKSKLPDARAEAAALPPPGAPPPVPAPVMGSPTATGRPALPFVPIPPESLPPPVHRTPSAAPK